MNKLTLIDGDTIIYLSTYTKEGVHKDWKEILTIVDNYILDILKKTSTEQYCGFLSDGSFRHKIAKIKEYKGNRKNLPKPPLFNFVKAYLQDVYNFVIIKNYEADDLCIMSKKSLEDTYDITIASPDKDLRQVAGKFYDYKKQESFDLTEEEANKNLWRQVLTGDTGDNIPGLPGIGPVKADKILNSGRTNEHYGFIVINEYINYYGEYDGIVNFCENYQLVKMIDRFKDTGELYYPDIQKISYSEEFNF